MLEGVAELLFVHVGLIAYTEHRAKYERKIREMLWRRVLGTQGHQSYGGQDFK
jgi:hypothetical protein